MTRVVAPFDPTPAERAALEGAGLGPVSTDPADLRHAELAVVLSFADLPEDAWEGARRLRAVLSLPAGADHVPFARLPPGVPVYSIHGPNAEALAEHAFALLLAGAKRVVADGAALRAGRWIAGRRSLLLAGSTLLVLGAGSVGSHVLRLGRAFGMRTVAVRRGGAPHPWADETRTPDALPEAWAEAQFLVLALPLTRATRGLIDAEALARMRPDAVLVNVARGKIVDQEALAAHLRAHPDFTYATDVWWRYPREGEAFDETLARLDNVVGTPHAGVMVEGWREKMVAAAARALADVAAGREPRNARREDPADSPRISP